MLLLDADRVGGDGRSQVRVPGGVAGLAGVQRGAVPVVDGFEVVAEGVAPRRGVDECEDGVGDADASPIEVSVVAEAGAAFSQGAQ